MASDAPTALMLSSAQHQHAVNNLLQQHVANMKAGRVQQCGLSAEQALLNKSSNVTTAQSTPDLMSLLMMQQVGLNMLLLLGCVIARVLRAGLFCLNGSDRLQRI